MPSWYRPNASIPATTALPQVTRIGRPKSTPTSSNAAHANGFTTGSIKRSNVQPSWYEGQQNRLYIYFKTELTGSSRVISNIRYNQHWKCYWSRTKCSKQHGWTLICIKQFCSFPLTRTIKQSKGNSSSCGKVALIESKQCFLANHRLIGPLKSFISLSHMT